MYGVNNTVCNAAFIFFYLDKFLSSFNCLLIYTVNIFLTD